MQLFMHTARLTCYEKSSILFFKGKCEENNPLSTPLFFPGFLETIPTGGHRKIPEYFSALPVPYGKRFPVCGISQRIYNIKEEM